MWGSWWDGATADAVFRAADNMPVREAVIGPWAHEGTSNASPLRRDDSERATVDLDVVVAFFRRHLMQRISAGQATVRSRPVAFERPTGWSLRLSVAGADAPSFERVPAVGGQRLQLAGEGCRLTMPVVR